MQKITVFRNPFVKPLYFILFVLLSVVTILTPTDTNAQSTRAGATYVQIKAHLDAVPAIDTHDHLRPFDQLTTRDGATGSMTMNLYTLLKNSYYSWVHPLAERKDGMLFDEWWAEAKDNFTDARATGFYRYLLPTFRDLYGVDFNRITDEQARQLDRKIIENYRDPRWIYDVVTERANIELMVTDPFYAPLKMSPDYPFAALALNVNHLLRGFHPSEYKDSKDNPYTYAASHGLQIETIDDYLAVLDHILTEAKAKGLPCLKNSVAYTRTLDFREVPKDRAAMAFGRPRKELQAAQARAFEDWVMWRIVELAAKHDLPIQIHTGHARIQGSNPMLLVKLIQSNKKTKFILFHGGFPWVGETGAIATRHTANVWIDFCWLPTLSYTMAKRALHEWLDVIPSNRIMWGADSLHVEGIYGSTVFTRRCLAEVLAEKVDAGDLAVEDALRIGKQILRENAISLMPGLKDRLWKHKGKLTPDGIVSPAK